VLGPLYVTLLLHFTLRGLVRCPGIAPAYPEPHVGSTLHIAPELELLEHIQYTPAAKVGCVLPHGTSLYCTAVFPTITTSEPETLLLTALLPES